MSSRLETEIEEQREANETALPFADLYADHREHLTNLVLRSAQDRVSPSLCLLGAGNCHDIDLQRLTSRFGHVHLVDLDETALARATAAVPPQLRRQLSCHAPVDLSGMLTKLEQWKRFALSPEDLIQHPAAIATALLTELGGPFDVVVSACVTTQMQLSILKVLTEQHRLFPAVRHTLTVTHLRTLAALTSEGGRAVIATDLVASDHLPLATGVDPAALRSIFEQVVRDGNVIYVSHPGVLKRAIGDDPILKRAFELRDIEAVWLWQQGPKRTFLVYAMDLIRRGAA